MILCASSFWPWTIYRKEAHVPEPPANLSRRFIRTYQNLFPSDIAKHCFQSVFCLFSIFYLKSIKKMALPWIHAPSHKCPNKPFLYHLTLFVVVLHHLNNQNLYIFGGKHFWSHLVRNLTKALEMPMLTLLLLTLLNQEEEKDHKTTGLLGTYRKKSVTGRSSASL